MCYALEICTNFLSRPYNSVREPLDQLFARNALPGQVIRQWSMWLNYVYVRVKASQTL